MNALLWFTNLLSWSAQAAIIALVAWLLVRLLRIREPRALLVQWRILIFACLLLPFVEPWHRPMANSLIPVAPVGSFPDFASARISAPPQALFSITLLAQITGVVILGGIALRLATMSLGLFKLRQLQRTSSPVRPQSNFGVIFEQIRSMTGARAETRISAQIDSPVTFGFAHPLILLPERFFRLDVAFQTAILCHELLHVRRSDWAHHLAEEILRVLLWFHPAILWLVARVRLAREQIVDLEVVQLTQARKTYLEALLEFTTARRRILAIPAPPFLAERQLVERISLMLKEVRMSRTRLWASLSAIAFSLALCAILAVSVFPLKAAPRVAVPHAQPSTLATRPVVEANSIWTDKVKRGDMPIEVAGIGTLVPARNSNELIAEVLISGDVAHEVRVGRHALVDTGKGAAKGHVTSLGSPDRNGNLWLDITPDSPLPQGSVANTSIRAFISVGKLQNVVYIGRPAGALAASANAGMPLFKLTQSGTEAVRVEVAFGRASATNIQVLSGLQPGDTVILSDMSPYDKFDRIQIKQ